MGDGQQAGDRSERDQDDGDGWKALPGDVVCERKHRCAAATRPAKASSRSAAAAYPRTRGSARAGGRATDTVTLVRSIQAPAASGPLPARAWGTCWSA